MRVHNQVWMMLVLLVTLGLAACSSAASEETHTAHEHAAAAIEMKVVATDLAFSTDTLRAKVGQPVTLHFRNEGALEHDWTVEGMRAEHVEAVNGGASAGHHAHMGAALSDEAIIVHVSALAGQEGTLTFTPTEPGRYKFVCTVAGHKEAGMHGTLVVEE